jgi:mono/diheme cytochrome c family protein
MMAVTSERRYDVKRMARRRNICGLETARAAARWRGAVLAVLVLLWPGAELRAGGDERAGRALVERLCSGCHAVAAGGQSRHPAAPPFAEVVRRYPPADLAEALAEGIAVGHQPIDMPEFAFTPTEVDDIIAYLDTLRRSTAGG